MTSRMRWAGHLVRMDAGKVAKGAEAEKHQGRRKRGRPQLRWEECMTRDMRRSGEDERWREGAADKKLWKKEQKEWLDNTLHDPHPYTAGNKEEEHRPIRWDSAFIIIRYMCIELTVIGGSNVLRTCWEAIYHVFIKKLCVKNED